MSPSFLLGCYRASIPLLTHFLTSHPPIEQSIPPPQPGEPPQTWVGAFLDSGDMEVCSTVAFIIRVIVLLALLFTYGYHHDTCTLCVTPPALLDSSLYRHYPNPSPVIAIHYSRAGAQESL